MRRTIAPAVVLMVLLGWIVVPGLAAEEPAAPVAVPDFLAVAPGQAPMTPATPAASPDLPRPSTGNFLSCLAQPCKNPPPNCITYCLGIGAQGGGCVSGCCICYSM
jgi:hypothetical protein